MFVCLLVISTLDYIYFCMAFHYLHDIQSLFLAWDNAEPDPYSESPLGKINAVAESLN
jgi:hypothetical protein